MQPVNLNALNPVRSVYSVIGNLCKDTNLLRESEVILTDRDFAQEFHQMVFNGIFNLTFSNGEMKSVNEIDLDNYFATMPQLYQKWEKHNGREYVRESIDKTKGDSFKTHYDKLKKFSLLRHYVKNGIEIDDVYDFTSTDLKVQEKGIKAIDKMSVQDIIDHFTLKMLKLKDEFLVGQESKNFRAGEDLDTLLEDLNTQPEFGYPFRNGFYNALFRGMRKGKFMLRSAGTGTGKTRQALADICNASIDEIYDLDKGWVSNGPAFPSLFISTELDKREVQTIMLAFISGVNEAVIKDGRYSDVITQRLRKAIVILKRAPIFCEVIEDFSIADIESIIEKNILQHNVKYVAFDYIQMTPKLSRSMASAFGTNLREDQILVQFSAALKTIANKYGVYITSSTQLNRSSKDESMRDTSSLRGGSATADKVDFGLMTFKVIQKDIDNIKHVLETGFYKKPNYSHWVYKNRSGTYSLCIIWTVMDLGNMREEPLFVTDTDYNLIPLDMIDIDYDVMDMDTEEPPIKLEEECKKLEERTKEEQSEEDRLKENAEMKQMLKDMRPRKMTEEMIKDRNLTKEEISF